MGRRIREAIAGGVGFLAAAGGIEGQTPKPATERPPVTAPRSPENKATFSPMGEVDKLSASVDRRKDFEEPQTLSVQKEAVELLRKQVGLWEQLAKSGDPLGASSSGLRDQINSLGATIYLNIQRLGAKDRVGDLVANTNKKTLDRQEKGGTAIDADGLEGAVLDDLHRQSVELRNSFFADDFRKVAQGIVDYFKQTTHYTVTMEPNMKSTDLGKPKF